MYEMSTDEGRCEAVAIDGVTNTTQEPWFTLAIQNRSAYDAVVVLAHMDCYDHFIDEIVAGIRVHQPDVPVQVRAVRRVSMALCGAATRYYNALCLVRLLLDILMPGGSGLSATTPLCLNPATTSTPLAMRHSTSHRKRKKWRCPRLLFS